MAFIFVGKNEAVLLHDISIEDFGGSGGIRDEGALESALAAAENRYYYEEASIAICAATYAYHLTNAHAFIDGNKRVATAASLSFLQTNGFDVEATDDELIVLFLDIAASRLSRQQVEEFFTTRLKPYVEE